MKVAVLMLSFNRYELLKKTLTHNVNNAGYPFDLYVWDNGSSDIRVRQYLETLPNVKSVVFNNENAGIAKPFNDMLNVICQDYDAFVFMANDIKEPKHWLLHRVSAAKAIQSSGMISVACSPHNYRLTVINGMSVYTGDVIGQFMITRQVFEKVGYLREDFGLYGPIDNDYNIRCRQLGFVNYYIPGISAIHLDDKDDKKYGYSKKDKVKETWQQFTQDVQRYADTEACYIPYDGQLTMNMKDNV
jgi:GT2 family glycosyltransferase